MVQLRRSPTPRQPRPRRLRGLLPCVQSPRVTAGRKSVQAGSSSKITLSPGQHELLGCSDEVHCHVRRKAEERLISLWFLHSQLLGVFPLYPRSSPVPAASLSPASWCSQLQCSNDIKHVRCRSPHPCHAGGPAILRMVRSDNCGKRQESLKTDWCSEKAPNT